jgi:sporulation protein YlmC with PRC-barrel domain
MASYPSQVATFPTHVNITEIIDASHPNNIQGEVVAIESTIGVDPTTSTTPSLSGTFNGTSTTFSTLKARIDNVETGVVSDAHSQYIRKTGDTANIITPSAITTKGLIVKATSGQTANLQEWQTSGGTATTYINASGALIGTASGNVPLSTVTAAGDLIIGTGSGTVSNIAIGTTGKALVSNGTTASWQTPTDTTKIPLSTVTTAGDIIVASGSGAVTRLGIGTNGQVLKSNGTTTVWADSVQGTTGAQGTTGLQGFTGTQGVQGIQGTIGTQGTQGTLGLQGTIGNQGVAGAVSAQGIQGTQGLIGLQGVQGLQGTTGSQGIQGTQGVGYVGVTSTTLVTPSNSGTITITTNTQGAFVSGNRVRVINTTSNYFEGVVTITGGTTFAVAADYSVGTTQASNWTVVLAGAVGTQGLQGTIGTQGLQGTIGVSLPTQTGNGGKYLTTDGSTASWGTAQAKFTVNTTPKTAAYTLATTDYESVVQMNGSFAFTIDTSLSAAPAGTQIHLLALTSGVSVTATGVTVNATPGLKIRTAYALATLICLGTNNWVLVGDLSA